MKKNSYLLVNELFLIQKTKLLYNQYKEFINYDSLPNCDIRSFNMMDNKDKTIDKFTNAKIEFKNNMPILYIEKHLFLFRSQTVNAILYHEFTHIWDEITYLQNLSYEERKLLLHSYTEYHATQIQLMCACNFNNINDNINIDKNMVVYNGIKPLNILEYLKSLQKNYLLTIKNIILKNFQPIETLFIVTGQLKVLK